MGRIISEFNKLSENNIGVRPLCAGLAFMFFFYFYSTEVYFAGIISEFHG